MKLPDLFETSINSPKTITWSKAKGSKKLTKSVDCKVAPSLQVRKKIVMKDRDDGR